MNYFYSIVESRLLLFYFIMFMLILLVKKLCRIPVIINAIWFSTDGTVPESALHNLVHLAENINKSIYRSCYKVLFWTDAAKLKPEIKKILKKNRIEIKDYRDLSPDDDTSRKLIEWINCLASMSYIHSKLHFVMASDMLRMYLLLKEIPKKHPKAIGCYIDCNDIRLIDIPNPKHLVNINTIAFHFVLLEFLPILKIIQCPQKTKFCLSNDIIITYNRGNQSFFDEIFAAYYNNLNHLDQQMAGIGEMYVKTLNSVNTLDQDTQFVIVFGTTHILNTLFLQNEETGDIYLLGFAHRKLEAKKIESIKDVTDFLNFTRNGEEGMTWVVQTPSVDNSSESLQAEIKNEHLEYWYQSFRKRAHLANEAINRTIITHSISKQAQTTLSCNTTAVP